MASDRPKKRFLGIHFDYHIRPSCTEVGKSVTRKMVQNIIDLVGPDFIQVDCKGHPGMASYPTKIGTPAPGFVKDQMKIWRDVTRKNGVGLFIHYSGVLDGEVLKKHPSWCQINENGNRVRATSVFGPYVEKLMIPQLKEVIDRYDIDGIWVDGDCWAMEFDQGKWARDAWKKQTGMEVLPCEPGDRNFERYKNFLRKGFKDYVRKYINEVKKHRPEIQITSNWAFSSYMMEPVDVPIDFISGDYARVNSVNSARYESRCISSQGQKWDLMAWGFTGDAIENYTIKAARQLMQEAACTLSQGGGFQVYWKQKPDCSIFDWNMDVMAEVAKFCRQREKYCFESQTVPQICMIHSTYAKYKNSTRLFGSNQGQTADISGCLQALLDSQYSVDILAEHSLEDRLKEYPIAVLPEWGIVSKRLKNILMQYVEAGGKLLIIGAEIAEKFRAELKIRRISRKEKGRRFLSDGQTLCVAEPAKYDYVTLAGAKTFGRIYNEDDFKSGSRGASVITKHQKGVIAATFFDVSEPYRNKRCTSRRNFLVQLINELFNKPIVEVEGSNYVDVSLRRKDDSLLVNLVNTAGPHGQDNIWTFDEIPPIGPLTIKIRCKSRPKKIFLAPGKRKIKNSWQNGILHVELDKLDIYEIIVLQ